MSDVQNDPDLADRMAWAWGAQKLFYRGGNGVWSYAALQPLDLLALVAKFAHLGPTKFMVDISGNCIVLHILGDTCTVGIAQVTEESWTFIRELKIADQLRVLREMQDALKESQRAEVEVPHGKQIH